MNMRIKLLLSSLCSLSLASSLGWAQEQTFNNIEFVQITAQNFTFGSLESQEGRTYFEKRLDIDMDHTFWIGKYEVTQAQWEGVMGYNPSAHLGLGPVASQPVESVSWNDIQLFVDRLNEAAGGEYYRLPTEAEWEYVARAGTDTRWSFGDSLNLLSNFTYTDNNPLPRTRGGRQANSYGVYDMYGNVYEWVEDWYIKDRNPDTGACPPQEGDYKVLRGGSNAVDPKFTRSTSRNFALPSRRSWKVGFRLVRVLDPELDRFRSGERCRRAVLGTDFYLQNLRTNGCSMFDHNNLTGDDRGGIAFGYGHMYYTGDSNTLKASADFASRNSVAQRDGLLSDLATEQVYHIALNGSLVSGRTNNSFNQLIRLDANLNPTNDVIALSQEIPIDNGSSGVFSGYGEALFYYNNNYYAANFITGEVDTIPGGIHEPSGCENWAFWGITERIDGIRYATYKGAGHRIVRYDIEGGQFELFATFNDLSDMCSFTVSPTLQRWYFHHEGDSQFMVGGAEVAGFCNADIAIVVDDALCGNNELNLGEQCDDGNNIQTDACLNTCVPATCGDGVVREGVEQCDDGGESAACNTNCTTASCGDGVVNVTRGEACDDGNTNNDDGCDAQCQPEASLFCYTGNRIRATSGFIDNWNGNNPQNSNGMIVSLQPDDMGNYTGCQGDGSGFYSNGGGHSPHTITRSDGQNFSALEFVAGDGWGQCTNYGYAVAYLDGQRVGECILNGQANQTIYGFSGAFDMLKVAFYRNASDRNQRNFGLYSAAFIDELRYGTH